MFRYYARLAALSLRQTPVLTGLMIGTIGMGIGVFMAALTVFYLMSNNPIRWKSDVLYAVQLDSWDPAEPWDDDRPELPPWELTWRDAMALRESPIPTRHAAMHKVSVVIQSDREGVKPMGVTARLTDGDFFALFDLEFIHGSAWDRSVDDAGGFQVVLSRDMNEQLFGGDNSVGRNLRINDRVFTVAGVTERWNPVPKFYDTNNGAFDDAEEVFLPLGVGRQLELFSAGNTNCWKDEEIATYQRFLESECVWWQYWAELPTAEQRDAYQDYIDNYVRGQARR
jgi:putative ABC transport system permease protein